MSLSSSYQSVHGSISRTLLSDTSNSERDPASRTQSFQGSDSSSEDLNRSASPVSSDTSDTPKLPAVSKLVSTFNESSRKFSFQSLNKYSPSNMSSNNSFRGDINNGQSYDNNYGSNSNSNGNGDNKRASYHTKAVSMKYTSNPMTTTTSITNSTSIMESKKFVVSPNNVNRTTKITIASPVSPVTQSAYSPDNSSLAEYEEDYIVTPISVKSDKGNKVTKPDTGNNQSESSTPTSIGKTKSFRLMTNPMARSNSLPIAVIANNVLGPAVTDVGNVHVIPEKPIVTLQSKQEQKIDKSKSYRLMTNPMAVKKSAQNLAKTPSFTSYSNPTSPNSVDLSPSSYQVTSEGTPNNNSSSNAIKEKAVMFSGNKTPDTPEKLIITKSTSPKKSLETSSVTSESSTISTSSSLLSGYSEVSKIFPEFGLTLSNGNNNSSHCNNDNSNDNNNAATATATAVTSVIQLPATVDNILPNKPSSNNTLGLDKEAVAAVTFISSSVLSEPMTIETVKSSENQKDDRRLSVKEKAAMFANKSVISPIPTPTSKNTRSNSFISKSTNSTINTTNTTTTSSDAKASNVNTIESLKSSNQEQKSENEMKQMPDIVPQSKPIDSTKSPLFQSTRLFESPRVTVEKYLKYLMEKRKNSGQNVCYDGSPKRKTIKSKWKVLILGLIYIFVLGLAIILNQPDVFVSKVKNVSGLKLFPLSSSTTPLPMNSKISSPKLISDVGHDILIIDTGGKQNILSKVLRALNPKNIVDNVVKHFKSKTEPIIS